MMRRWPATVRRERRLARAQPGGRESGYTLIELTISLLLFGLLLTTVPIVVQTMFSNQNYVNNTFLNLDELLPVSTKFQQLIRAVVAPAPTETGDQPVPAFGTYDTSGKIYCTEPGTPQCASTYSPAGDAGPTTPNSYVVSGLSDTSATFFSNIGQANGPVMVVANLVNTCTGSGATMQCIGTFTVTLADAIIPTGDTTSPCPFADGDYPPAYQCVWGTPEVLFEVQDVVNQCSESNSFANCTQPVFQYTLQGPVDPSMCAVNESQTGCVPNPQDTFSQCLAPVAGVSQCPANEIQDVGIDLKVNASPRPGSSQADEQTVVYELSENSATYSPDVG
jgi:type II secretory pathway pseudopilin PulG